MPSCLKGRFVTQLRADKLPSSRQGHHLRRYGALPRPIGEASSSSASAPPPVGAPTYKALQPPPPRGADDRAAASPTSSPPTTPPATSAVIHAATKYGAPLPPAGPEPEGHLPRNIAGEPRPPPPLRAAPVLPAKAGAKGTPLVSALRRPPLLRPRQRDPPTGKNHQLSQGLQLSGLLSPSA